jgi:hypothetical protein
MSLIPSEANFMKINFSGRAEMILYPSLKTGGVSLKPLVQTPAPSKKENIH